MVKIQILATLKNNQIAIYIGFLGIYHEYKEKLAIYTKLELIWIIFDQVMATSNFKSFAIVIWMHFFTLFQKMDGAKHEVGAFCLTLQFTIVISMCVIPWSRDTCGICRNANSQLNRLGNN